MHYLKGLLTEAKLFLFFWFIVYPVLKGLDYNFRLLKYRRYEAGNPYYSDFAVGSKQK